MRIKKTKKAMTLAAGIMKNAKEVTRKEAMITAWAAIKKAGNAFKYLEATKVDGTLTKRIVLTNWIEHNRVKGTGRPLKPGQRLFIDVAKAMAKCKNTTVSFYIDNIKTLAA